MTIFFKAAAAVVVTAILGLTIEKKEIASLVSLGGCILAAMVLMEYLSPILRFLKELCSLGAVSEDSFSVLLQAFGVGLISELCAMFCKDTGNSSLGKSVQLLGCCVILYSALPLAESFIALLQDILGGL